MDVIPNSYLLNAMDKARLALEQAEAEGSDNSEEEEGEATDVDDDEPPPLLDEDETAVLITNLLGASSI